MNDRVERKQIGFPEFGVRFIHAAITPERLKSRIGGMIGPIAEINAPAHEDSGLGEVTANGAFVSVDVVELTSNELQLAAVYDVRLGVNLKIVVNLFNLVSGWDGAFSIPLQMSVNTYTPLELEIGYRPVVGTDIASAFEAIDLLGAFPPYKDMVRTSALEKIAAAVNEKMDAALKDRRIDVLKALAAMDAPEDPAAKPEPATGEVSQLRPGIDQPVAMLPGEKFEGGLVAGERSALQITVDPDTVAELTMAARLSEQTNYGTTLVYKMIDPDGIVLDSGSTETVYDYQDFEAVSMRFYHARYRGLARIVLASNERDLQVRGRLTFSRYVG